MSPDQEKDFTHNAFTGLRNTVAQTRFSLADLAIAENVDIDDTGALRRRQGYGDAVIGGSWHSLWSNGARCFGVTGATLREISASYSTTTLATVTAGLRVKFHQQGSRIYWSNGKEKGVIEFSNRSWGLDVPGKISATEIGGSLRAGRYQFVMTYLRDDGQESGAPIANYLDISGSGGLLFSGLPVSGDPTVASKAIYVSEPNGATMFWIGTIDNDVTTHVFNARRPMTLPLATQFLGPPPVGVDITFHGGRLFVARGNLLYYSEPFAFELFDRRKSFVLPSRITALAGLHTGIFIGTEQQHFWLAGKEIQNYELEERAGGAAIPGTVSFAPKRMFEKSADETIVAIWQTSDGIVMGEESGALTNLTADRFIFPSQPVGSSVVRTSRGTNQFVSVLQGTETPAPAYS